LEAEASFAARGIRFNDAAVIHAVASVSHRNAGNCRLISASPGDPAIESPLAPAHEYHYGVRICLEPLGAGHPMRPRLAHSSANTNARCSNRENDSAMN